MPLPPTHSPLLPYDFVSRIASLLETPTQTHWVGFLICSLFGLIVGSFLNVVIYRDGRNLSVSHPRRSFCPHCQTSLTWQENIPLLSYVIQYGRCRSCKQAIPLQYPLVELAFGVLTPLLWDLSGNLQEFLVLMTFCACAIPAALIDLKTLQLPDYLTIGGTLTILALCLASPEALAYRTQSALLSFFSMATLYGVGKALFKNKKTQLSPPAPTRWVCSPENSFLQLAEDHQTLESTEKIASSDLFETSETQIKLEGSYQFHTPESPHPRTCKSLLLSPLGTQILDTGETLPHLSAEGVTTTLHCPSTPMGWGDVKLMALCGATLGFGTALQSLTLAACGGLLFLLTLRIIAKIQKKPIPELIAFGPWIIASCLANLFLKL